GTLSRRPQHGNWASPGSSCHSSDMGNDGAVTTGDRAAGSRGAALYPMLLEPLLVERIWGADELWRRHTAATAARGAVGRSGDSSRATGGAPATPIGEIWLLCDDNVVLNGALTGKRVVEVIDDLGAGLLGSANLEAYGTKLALLAKFLDAAEDLSIQVHPDDAYALAHEAATGHLGKAEAWYVIAADEGASVVWGFRTTLSQAEVRAAVAEGTLAALLNRLPVRTGDVIGNPAGTVHAVGAGLQLFEIQQASDLTYRLYDYGRRDATGALRELHLDKALDVADLTKVDSGAGLGGVASESAGDEAGWVRLVTTPQFTLESVLLGDGSLPAGGDRWPGRAKPGDYHDCSTSERSFDLLVCVAGTTNIEPPPRGAGAAFSTVSLTEGGAALLPAALGGYRLSGSGEVLRSRVGSGR